MNIGSHHAYFIEGHRENTLIDLVNYLENEMDFKTKGNPDYISINYESFSIDDSRALKEMHAGSALSGSKDAKRIFVISFNTATHEAQNSLLKIFEEPNATSRFFIIAPSAQVLLPTLRSRVEIIKTEKGEKGSNESNSEIKVTPKEFVNMSLGERMKFIKTVSEKVSKEIVSKSDIFSFLENVSNYLREHVISKNEDPKKLKSVLKSISYISDRSSSVKMILENLAISL